MIHHFLPPPVEVGSRWRLPSGAVVEVLPTSNNEDMVCKYRRNGHALNETEHLAGVTLSIDFLHEYGRPI